MFISTKNKIRLFKFIFTYCRFMVCEKTTAGYIVENFEPKVHKGIVSTKTHLTSSA